MANTSADVDEAIRKLRSFTQGDLSIAEAVSCGRSAIPGLRAMLFEREPSGLHQARCRAVEALAALGAYDVLLEFLTFDRTVSDPVESLGEDAVINAAALAVSNLRDDRVFDLLLLLADRPWLSGVIGALAAFNHAKAMPALIRALEDDFSRPTAEAALRKLGPAARTDLVAAALLQLPSPEHESETSRRRRRSALALLERTGISERTWPALRQMLQDQDPAIALFACRLCLSSAPKPEQQDAIRRLIALLREAHGTITDEIEACLVDHFADAKDIMIETVARNVLDRFPDDKVQPVLSRVLSRAAAKQLNSPDLLRAPDS